MEHLNQAKVIAMNFMSWLGAIVSLQDINNIMSVFAFVGSISVSGYTIWWIKKQAKALDFRDKGGK
jgi:hypothetical protein